MIETIRNFKGLNSYPSEQHLLCGVELYLLSLFYCSVALSRCACGHGLNANEGGPNWSSIYFYSLLEDIVLNFMGYLLAETFLE